MNEAVNIDRSREAFIEDLRANNYTTYLVATHPKYAKGKGAFRFTSSPVSPADPYHWRYVEARRRLIELSGLLTTEEAERRNINFVNPGLRDFMPAATLPTLRGGIQMLLPGEKACTHRHSANAFRTILEAPAEGAYTVVEGTRIPMHPGDLVLTPNWTWHDHHNEGDAHAIWYDGLDVLVAYWIGGTFFQEYQQVSGQPYFPVKRDVSALVSTYGAGLVNHDAMLPDHVPSSNNTLLYYPYSKARKLLQGLSEAGSGNPRDGVLVEYVNPLTGGSAFPSMSHRVRLVNGRTSLEAWHRTENIIFVTLEGSVSFTLPNNVKYVTERHDVVAIPSWVPYSISNSDETAAVLFSHSDRPLFDKLGFYREQRAE
ncbi:MAG: cupin domain-containing protein [Steroidobacteraceae bacterium]